MGRAKNQRGQRMLAGTRPAPQVCRQLAIVCPGCGCRARMTRRWIEAGLPTCVCGAEFVCEVDEALKRSVRELKADLRKAKGVHHGEQR